MAMRRATTVLFQINLFDQALSDGSVRAAGASEELEQPALPGLSPAYLKTMGTSASPTAYF